MSKIVRIQYTVVENLEIPDELTVQELHELSKRYESLEPFIVDLVEQYDWKVFGMCAPDHKTILKSPLYDEGGTFFEITEQGKDISFQS